MTGQFEAELDRHQQLADAVVQLAGNPRTLLLLGTDDALRQQLQLAVGQALLADIQGQASGRHQQHRHQRHAGQRPHGAADVLRHLGPRLLGGQFDIIEIEAGADHPVPALEHHHVGELFGQLAGGRFLPLIALEAVAAARAEQQRLDRLDPMRIGHVHQVAADQLRLARVHQVAPLAVVDEEIAIAAVIEAEQDAQHLLLGDGIVATAGIQRRDRAQAQFDVVLQLGLLAGDDAGLDQQFLLLAQALGMRQHQRADHGNGQQQRQNGEGDDLLFELHGGRCWRAD
ncbi:hypothetical protein D3C86_1375700 [compost metagenome]